MSSKAEAIRARVVEILADWPATTEEQRESAVRILAARRSEIRTAQVRRAA